MSGYEAGIKVQYQNEQFQPRFKSNTGLPGSKEGKYT